MTMTVTFDNDDGDDDDDDVEVRFNEHPQASHLYAPYFPSGRAQQLVWPYIVSCGWNGKE